MPETSSPSFAVGTWASIATLREPVLIVEVETFWGQTVYRVWIPHLRTVERVAAEFLSASDSRESKGLDHIIYTANAARVADALTQDVLLAPLEAGVIPLPHQLHVLARAMTDQRIRYLLADEVGLGKTIEAGLVFRELKLRGLVKRVLVVAPKGLVTQWVQEMRTHFGEEFRLLIPSEFSSWRSLTNTENVWRQFDQVVCPVDSIKPVERRSGWSHEKVENYNQERLGDLLEAGWDLIICDEAHRLSGSTDQVARYRLGKALAEAAPFLLLLSATPHQGKSEAFQRLMALLDKREFSTDAPMKKEKVVPFVIRTEKSQTINDRGGPLFLPRKTKLVPVGWKTKHRTQKELYESVTEYVRLGYNQAVREKRQYLGFLMILMQRLVTSSTEAIATTLERRLEALQTADIISPDDEPNENNFYDADGQEQLEELLGIRLAGTDNEKKEVQLLLDLARRCQAQGPDARAEALLEILYEKQREENNPELKFLIFTEFVPTQNMLLKFLEQHGFSAVWLNGSLDLDERRQVQRNFAEKSRILISTDAGGEGLNLQFAHIIINYDLPWNPMRIEQRIGRVDRIGQKFPVCAYNLIFEDSVELRVQEVLECKLATILDEFGVDKTQDVLDSSESGAAFERLYAQAILNPGDIKSNIDKLIHEVREQARQEVMGRSYYAATVLDPKIAQQLSNHPLPFWVEHMATAFVRSRGHSVQRDLFSLTLEWPDGSTMDRVSFHSRDAQERGLTYVNLTDPRINSLVQELPRVLGIEPIPCVHFPSLPTEIVGYWSLWRIALDNKMPRDVKIVALFHHDDGRILLPTAQRIWDSLLEEYPEVNQIKTKVGNEIKGVLQRLRADAELQGEHAFHELLALHKKRLKQEQEKDQYAFQARREALNRIGLPEVRQHRLKRLGEEERVWAAKLREREHVLPDLQPIIFLRVEAGNG